MVAPLTPKPTHKAKALVRASPTIVLCHEEDAALKKLPLTRYCSAVCILETKTKVGSTTEKAPGPRTHPNIDEAPTAPKSHTHPSHECDGWVRDPEATATPPTPKTTRKAEALVRASPTITSRREEDSVLRKWSLSRYCSARCILETKTKVGSTAVKAPDPCTYLPKYRWDDHHTQTTHPPIPPVNPLTINPGTSFLGFTSSSILSFSLNPPPLRNIIR